MNKLYCLLAFSCALLGPLPVAHTEDLTLTFTVPTPTAAPGSSLAIWLHVLNPSPQPVSWTFPTQIQTRLRSSPGTVAAPLVWNSAETATVVLPPGSFARREYRLAIPNSTKGQTILEFANLSANPVIFNAQATAAESQPVKSTMFNRFITDAEPAPPDEIFRPGRFFKEHISAYEPFYFVAGTKSPNAKFQISFKYQLLNTDGPLAKSLPSLKGFHVAYTQTSLWNLNGPSPAFFDTSYKPEFLYVSERLVGGQLGDQFRLDLQGGLQHESNGRGGIEERSLNIAYIRPTLVFGQDDGLQFTLQPRAWVYLAGLAHNPDFADYRGYVDLRTVLGWRRGLQLSALGRIGQTGNHESLQLDLTYPTMRFFGSFSLFLDVQYFTGYCETLLGYQKRSNGLRVGLSLFR